MMFVQDVITRADGARVAVLVELLVTYTRLRESHDALSRQDQ